MKLKICYEVECDNQSIDDIMVTALEGGITYWCDKVTVVGDYLGEMASDQISRGGTLRLHVIKENQWYNLSLDKFKKGLAKVVGERGLNIIYNGAINAEEIDCNDADAIIQYAIFNEIIYG